MNIVTEQKAPRNNGPLRVAAYCRVSTDREEQEGSYELQESHFTSMIQENPGMTLAGIYGDKGKSGLKMSGRPGLQSLLSDCREGKIDTIYTKSISRFARNMGDCAEMIRELKGLGVNVVFEKEKLDTRDKKCSLILNVFAAIAQEESRSISQNMIMSHEQAVLEGRPYGTISYGYKNGGDNQWVINEEEAATVRKAFRLAMEGTPFQEILAELNATETGRGWKYERLKRLLTNPVYKGDYYSHATVSLTPGKQVKNDGYRDRFYIKGHHSAIIAPEDFDFVQEIVKRGCLRQNRHLKKADREFLKEGAQHGNNSDHE